MSLGLQTPVNITMNNLTSMINDTDVMVTVINMNHTIYGGFFFFILLWVLYIILYFAFLNNNEDIKNIHDYLVYSMYSLLIVSLLSFFLRVIYIVRSGVMLGLINDWQLWIFPIFFILNIVAIRIIASD
jgi:hypothetical protein